MEIIKTHADDIDVLLALSRKTFYESFNHLNTSENMEAYMNMAFTRQRLLSELNNENSEFYFAKDGEEIVGYLKLNKKDAQTEFKGDSSIEIERIYIDSNFQGKGYGTLFLDKVREIAISGGNTYIWLGVWEKNPDAIRFYERNGFDVFSSHEFQMGDEVQIDKLMICKI